MNLLLDGLPRAVSIRGREVPIEAGYRAGIRFERLLRDRKLSNAEKLERAIGLYFKPGDVGPEDVKDAVDAVIWFYRCGREPPEKKEQYGAEAAYEPEKAFDYEHDAGYIYAAFMQAYRIDLTKNLHWWQFRALFQALPEDTMMMKIIGYRTAKVPPKASSEQRQRIEELKRVYALPLDADQQKLKTDLEAILMAGGDVSAILGQEGAGGNGI